MEFKRETWAIGGILRDLKQQPQKDYYSLWGFLKVVLGSYKGKD